LALSSIKWAQSVAQFVTVDGDPEGASVDNPFNPNVRGIGKKEIEDIFPYCQFEYKLINFNPFIARPLSKFSWRLCEVLEKIPILCTQWLVTIKKQFKNGKKYSISV